MRQDLHNHLRHYPVSVRVPTKSYLLSRWLYRHRLGATAATAIMITLLAGLTVSIRQTELANANARRAQAVQTFLMDIFNAADPVANQQNPVLVNDLLRQQQEKLRLDTTTEPLLQQELRRTLASLQSNLGNHADALKIDQNLLAELPDDASRAQQADLHTRIATHYELLGQLQTALQHADTATDLAPLADGVSIISLQAVRTQASIHSELRDNETAISKLEQALRYREAILALDDGKPLLGSLLADLSEKYGMLGDTDTALETLAEARQWYAQAYPEIHPEQAQADAREAGIHRAAGDFSQAAAASLRATQKSKQLFGDLHSQSLRNETSLAVDLAYLKCYHQAIGIYQQTVARYQQLFGENNLLYANALLNLASMRRKLNDHATALEEINTTLSIYARHGEQATDMQAYALSIKAQLLFALDDVEQAMKINTQAMHTMRESLGDQHPEFLRVQTSQGHLAARLKKWELAESHLLPAYQGLLEVLGAQSAFTRDTAMKLAGVYQATNNETALQVLLSTTGLTNEDLTAELTSTETSQASSACALPKAFDLSGFDLASR
jgi:serine/threonine-protein kinase